MFSKDFLTEEAINKLIKIVEIEQKINRGNLIYKTDDKKKDKKYDCQKFKAIRYFRREIYNNKLTLEDALQEQIKFKNEIDKFKESTQRKTLDKKEKIVYF